MKNYLYKIKACGIGIAVLIAIADQLSKLWINELVASNLLPLKILSFFNLVIVYNKGISFGMLSNSNIALINIVLPIFLSFITIFLLFWLLKSKEKLVIVALGFIIGGATGNLIDRVFYGAVTDFLDFHIGYYHYPAFNIADSAIFIGVAIIVITGFFDGKKNEQK